MAPVVPFLGLIGTVVGAGVTAATSIYSANKADRAAKQAQARQDEYYNQLKAEEASVQAEEKRITDEAQRRTNAYRASLMTSGTALQNMLSGGYESDSTGGEYSLLGTSYSGGVSSVFA